MTRSSWDRRASYFPNQVRGALTIVIPLILTADLAVLNDVNCSARTVLFGRTLAALGPQKPAFIGCEDALLVNLFLDPGDHFFGAER